MKLEKLCSINLYSYQTISDNSVWRLVWGSAYICQTSPCGICGRQSVTGAGVTPSSSVFSCQYHSTNIAHSCFTNLPTTLYNISTLQCRKIKHFCLPCLSFSIFLAEKEKAKHLTERETSKLTSQRGKSTHFMATTICPQVLGA